MSGCRTEIREGRQRGMEGRVNRGEDRQPVSYVMKIREKGDRGRMISRENDREKFENEMRIRREETCRQTARTIYIIYRLCKQPHVEGEDEECVIGKCLTKGWPIAVRIVNKLRLLPPVGHVGIYLP